MTLHHKPDRPAQPCLADLTTHSSSRHFFEALQTSVDTDRWVEVLMWIGVAWFAIRLDVWRTSSTLFFIVQRITILGSCIRAFFSMVALLQTYCLYVNPMHVVVTLETVLHVGKILSV